VEDVYCGFPGFLIFLMQQTKYRSGLSSLRMALARRAFGWILRGRNAQALPPHMVPLGDEVSSEMIVAGLHEGALLESLFDVFLQDRQKRFQTQIALDVGANIGNHALFFSRHFKSVIAVEPNPRTLHVLRANVALSGAPIHVLPLGFADRDARLEFLSNTHGNLGASGFVFAGGPTTLATGERIECPVRRGDEVLREGGFTGIGLIKLDVEGAELAALRGLTETLRSEQPLVLFECLQSDGPEGGGAIFEFLRAQGYAQFFAVESSVGSVRPSLWSWLKRLWQGEIVRLRPLARPESGQAYLMILALPAGQTPAA